MRRGVVGLLMLVAACAESSKSVNTAAPGSADSAAQARAELVQAQSDLDLALGAASPGGVGAVPESRKEQGTSCAAACRALASLERAADHLCALSDPSECADAKSRVERARDRVLKACGDCH
jgi:hypothetical protein